MHPLILSRRKKMDFIVYEAPDERILFRFYPRKSTVWGKDETPPNNWDKVMMVDYSWAIFRQVKWRSNDVWESELMFRISCDENSRLGDVPRAIDKVQEEDLKSIFLRVFGDGAEWNLTYYKKEEPMIDDTIEIQVWDRLTRKGYKFPLFIKEAKRFQRYIEKIQKYMLQFGIPNL